MFLSLLTHLLEKIYINFKKLLNNMRVNGVYLTHLNLKAGLYYFFKCVRKRRKKKLVVKNGVSFIRVSTYKSKVIMITISDKYNLQPTSS